MKYLWNVYGVPYLRQGRGGFSAIEYLAIFALVSLFLIALYLTSFGGFQDVLNGAWGEFNAQVPMAPVSP